jgi:putative FmdB family regulatory protein
MPIYENKCAGCGHEFEALVIPQSPGAPECPKCHSTKLDQLLSLFGASSEERSKANWQAARKKYERTELRDKKVAEREEIEHHRHDH